MGGIILCNKRSIEPYFISELNLNVYSIEEIGYFIYNNAFIVGKEFFSINLVTYIKDKLHLKSVADKLEDAIEKSLPLQDLMYLVLKESGYYTDEELNKIKTTLPQLASKSTQERFKAKANLFYENNKFESALQEYYKILEMKREPKLTSVFYAEIVNNIAIIYTKLFLYDEAEKYFRKAYELYHSTEYLRKLIFVSLLYGGEQKLLGNRVKYDMDEEFVEACKKEFEEASKSAKEKNEHKELQFVIDVWKEEYRDLMV